MEKAVRMIIYFVIGWTVFVAILIVVLVLFFVPVNLPNQMNQSNQVKTSIIVADEIQFYREIIGESQVE